MKNKRGAVGLVTCAEFPDLAEDDRLLRDALIDQGISAAAVVWDDPAADWSRFDVCVIRSTWDYHLRRDEFLDWVGRAAAQTTLLNPPELLRWNSHKTYLRDLAARGVATVPAVWLAAGERLELAALVAERGWSRLVIKPTVGLNSFGAGLFGLAALAEAQQHLDRLLAERDAVVQPFIASVQSYGERSLLFIDGQFTHAVNRTPPEWETQAGAPSDSSEHPLSRGEDKTVTPRADEMALAEGVLARLAAPPLYARVDVVRGDGRPLLLELELVEPSLFLDHAPEAVARLAAAIARRCAAAPGR